MIETSLRDAAWRIITSPDLEAKLRVPVRDLADDVRDVDALPIVPTRSADLSIRKSREARVPPLAGFADPAQRVRIVHALANHELQAVELFAWALLAYPDAPSDFRRGLVSTLVDEQRHCQLYIEWLREAGMGFGELPVSGYFWGKVSSLSSPVHFVCAMCLTFENANLDHADALMRVARERKDIALVDTLEQVHRDEVRHVAFGWRWLEALKADGETMWDAYLAHTRWPLRPSLARGADFDPEARRRAGFDEAFIEHLASATRGTP